MRAIPSPPIVMTYSPLGLKVIDRTPRGCPLISQDAMCSVSIRVRLCLADGVRSGSTMPSSTSAALVGSRSIQSAAIDTSLLSADSRRSNSNHRPGDGSRCDRQQRKPRRDGATLYGSSAGSREYEVDLQAGCRRVLAFALPQPVLGASQIAAAQQRAASLRKVPVARAFGQLGVLPEPSRRRLEQRLQLAGTPPRIAIGAVNPLPRRNRGRHEIDRRLAKGDGYDALAEIDRGGDLDRADARLT